MGEVVPSRVLNLLYICLDIVFLAFLCALFVWRRKFLTLFFSLAGGILYFIVDYGIFYGALHSREVVGAPTGWFLLWLSMSYGITNFGWIWLWLDHDPHLFEWSLLIWSWWITCPLLNQNFGLKTPEISIKRGTNSYHGVMAAILFVGYAIIIIHNMVRPKQKIFIPWLLAIGILVQFAWEFSLLITGIRAPEWGPLVVDSLIETNLGIPYIYFIHKAITSRFTEDLHRHTPNGYQQYSE